MAAIKPHLETAGETTKIEELHDACGAHSTVKRSRKTTGTCPTSAATVAEMHSGLLNMVWVRQVVEQSLIGRQVSVQFGKVSPSGGVNEPNTCFLVLDQALPNEPAWNPVPGSGRNFNLLTWTSKMGCPSWSLPAGALEIGGACPGAVAGQSTSPPQAQAAQAKRVLQVLKEPVKLADSVCERCYATGGQYATGQVQVAQILRYHWTRYAMRNGTFVPTMVAAISGAEFSPKERSGQRFFRIHDSGDFYDREYLRAWKQIADALPDITFWAPTRIWATNWGVSAVNEINRQPRNFVLRPSAYHVNEHGPEQLGPGWAEAAVVYNKRRLGEGDGSTFDWNCRAYASENKDHTCLNAESPDGDHGCRACWVHRDLRINYTEH